MLRSHLFPDEPFQWQVRSRCYTSEYSIHLVEGPKLDSQVDGSYTLHLVPHQLNA